jgi:hypothetical protein
MPKAWRFRVAIVHELYFTAASEDEALEFLAGGTEPLVDDQVEQFINGRGELCELPAWAEGATGVAAGKPS